MDRSWAAGSGSSGRSAEAQCAWCGRLRDEHGMYGGPPEPYSRGASHTICPRCRSTFLGPDGPAPVLVVDDDPDVVELAQEVLTTAGHDVAAAADGREALERLDAGLLPGVILLDMRMPGLDGWGFAAALRVRGRTLDNVVVMTAAKDAGDWAEEIGAAGCLAKPFRPDDLLATTERVCGPGYC